MDDKCRGTYIKCRRCLRKVYGIDLAAIRFGVINVYGDLWVICGKCLDKHGNTGRHSPDRKAPTEEP